MDDINKIDKKDKYKGKTQTEKRQACSVDRKESTLLQCCGVQTHSRKQETKGPPEILPRTRILQFWLMHDMFRDVIIP